MVAERVDVDTENYVSLARDHREIRVVDGNAEHLDTYSQDVELLLLGTRPEYCALLAPRLVAVLPAKWRRRAKRRGARIAVDENGDPADLESITSADGAPAT